VCVQLHSEIDGCEGECSEDVGVTSLGGRQWSEDGEPSVTSGERSYPKGASREPVKRQILGDELTLQACYECCTTEYSAVIAPPEL